MTIKNKRLILMFIGIIAFGIVVLYFLNAFSSDGIIRQNYDGECVIASGDVIKKSIDVELFNAVILGGSGNLYVTQDGTNSLEVEAYENVLEMLEMSVDGGVLTFDYEQCITYGFLARPMNIYVTMDDVTKLRLDGSGKIIGNTDISSESLELVVAGSGGVNLNLDVEKISSTMAGSGIFDLSGTATEQNVILSGSGTINAYDLISEKTTVLVAGSGNAYVYASEELNTQVEGSGSVAYRGDPKTINQ